MFGGFKRWRANRKATQKFYDDRREKFKNWVCKICQDDFFEEWDNWFKIFIMNVSKENEELCRRCYSGAQKERERRIELARQIVGQLMFPAGFPYRGHAERLDQSPSSAWKLAINTANADPFRLKQYDDFVRL